MEVKIINNKLDDFGGVFKVRRMNFDNIIINYPIGSGIKSFSFEDVECIRQNDIDEFLIKNRDFLKIKLKRGISVIFYNALYESLYEETTLLISPAVKFAVPGEVGFIASLNNDSMVLAGVPVPKVVRSIEFVVELVGVAVL